MINFATDFYDTAVQLKYAFYNGEPQSGIGAACAVYVLLIKSFKNSWQVFSWYAATSIGNLYNDIT